MAEHSISDPAMLLLTASAALGIVAAIYWAKVSMSIDETGKEVRGPDKRTLSHAAMITALALGLACTGFLLGRYTGRF